VTAGVLSARAGADFLLYTGPGNGVLPALIRAANSGQISQAGALASYKRIVALKRRLVPQP
jgi:hypothetical protein